MFAASKRRGDGQTLASPRREFALLQLERRHGASPGVSERADDGGRGLARARRRHGGASAQANRPIHLACAGGFEDVVGALVLRGCVLSAQNANGALPSTLCSNLEIKALVSDIEREGERRARAVQSEDGVLDRRRREGARRGAARARRARARAPRGGRERAERERIQVEEHQRVLDENEALRRTLEEIEAKERERALLEEKKRRKKQNPPRGKRRARSRRKRRRSDRTL